MNLPRAQSSAVSTTCALAILLLAGCSAPADDATPGMGGSGAGGAGTGGATSGTGGATAGTGGGGAGAGGMNAAGMSGSGGTAGSAGSSGSGGTAGSGGSAGTGGNGGSGGAVVGPYGPVSCQPEFETVCKPPIEYTNEEPTQAALIDELYPEIEPFLQDILCTVCSVLYRSADEVPSPPSPVKLVVRNISPPAQAGGDQIELDSDHVQNQEGKSEELQRIEMRGVLFHEAVHLYQYYGTGGLGEGNADHARIRVGLYEPGRRHSGGSWTDPYTTSGFFFSWLAGPCEYHSDSHVPYDVDLPYKINQRVGEAEDANDDVQQAVADLLQEIYGSDVDTLWAEYQAAIQ